MPTVLLNTSFSSLVFCCCLLFCGRATIPPHVDVHDLVVLGQVGRLDAAHGQDPGAVDQHIQPAVVSQGLLHRPLHRLLVGEVSRDQQRLRNEEGGQPEARKKPTFNFSAIRVCV